MNTSAFPNLKKARPRFNNITDATLRDFSGGLKVVESDVTLKSKYAVVLDNMFTNDDFSQTLRFGTKEFADTGTGTVILETIFFANSIIACLTNGQIKAINSAGTVVTIWSTAIAAALPGAPAGWGTTATHIDSTEDSGSLIITNNVDKPIIISQGLTVDYLQDLATLTNINTPIGRHIVTVGDFTVMSFAGNDPEIAISSQNASGTWVGDAPPNNAITKKLGGFVQKGSGAIIGLHSFKNRLLVFFAEAVVIVELGIFDALGVHTPNIVDTIYNTGLISHRCFFVTDTDFVYLSKDGINAAKRNAFGVAFDSRLLSEDIQQLIYKNTPQIGSSSGYSFVVADKAKRKVFFFIRRADGQKFILALSHSPDLREVRWSTITGWDFDGGCATDLKRVFLFKTNKIYQYGNDIFPNEDYRADLIATTNVTGNAITFDWEFPWIDTNSRAKTKNLIKINADTLGEADFNLSLFVDKYYKDIDDNYDPALTMLMRAGSVTGYGTPSVGYGGGRRMNDERFYGFPLLFKLLKMRIHGSTRSKLLITSITLLYSTGSYQR